MTNTKKIFFIGVPILLLVVIGFGLYAYLNYSYIDGKVVSNDELTYADYEKSANDSYNSADVNAQVEYATKLHDLGIDKDASALVLAKALLNKGSLTFNESENADKAIELLNDILSRNPDNEEALATMGYAYEIKQEYDKAFEYYGKALAIDPEDDYTYVRRGHAYELYGNYALAQDDYLKAYSIDPNKDVTLMNIARMYYATGDYKKAVDFASSTLNVTQNNYVKAVSSELVGQAAIQNDEYDLAQQYFDYAIQSDPTYPGPYLQSAYVDVIQSNTASSKDKDSLLSNASDDVDTALSYHSDSSFAYTLKGLISDQRGQSTEAQNFYKTALSIVDKDITLGKIDKDNTIAQLKKLIK